ncbi:MAG: sugar transferase [Patescibacteria group bacterium]|jgi:exopolysaccharide biosynthesis polyprenyl glycosylphosphotransferase
MKKLELWFTALLPVLDFVAVFLSILVAKNLRTTLDILPLDQTRVQINNYHFLIWYLPILIFFYAFHRLYILSETRKSGQQLIRVVSATSTTIMIMLMVVLFGRTPFIENRYENWFTWSNNISLLTIVYFWIASIIVTFGVRLVYRFLLNLLLEEGIGQKRVLLIGNTKVAKTIIDTTSREKSRGLKVIGVLKTVSNTDHHIEMKCVGTLADIDDAIAKLKPDIIIQADPDLDDELMIDVIDRTNELRLDFIFAPNLFEVLSSNVQAENIGGVPLLALRRTPLDGWGKIFKRAMDIVGSLLLLIILSPVILVTAILVKLQDLGPIFFSHDRISRGKPFKMYKFRSMVKNAEKLEDKLRQQSNERGDGPLFKMKHDPRVTPLGRFLRASRIDEIPQLVNVLFGKMSLVGPRPHLAKEIANYQKHHRKVLAIKPGMTGMAQISGSSDLSFEEEVRLDTYYIEHWSLWADIAIIIKTPWMIIFKDRSGC